MVISGVTVETAVPTSLEADVRVIHGLQVEVVYRSISPDVGGVIVNDLGDGIIDVDVEYVPSSGIVPGVGHCGYGGSVFGANGDNVGDISPFPGPIAF